MLSNLGYDNYWQTYDLSDFEPTNVKSTIRKQECQEYLFDDSRTKNAIRIWSAPNLKYAILRMEFIKNGKLEKLYDMENNHIVEIDEWIPSKWIIAKYDRNAKLISRLTAIVSQFDYQSPISDKEIDFQFPVGTKIADNRTKTIFLLGEAES